ncbi:uncharacterized protein PGTG_11813 [Puccinia graminis f. sp. tritici CRL 75-36-700-3]|uniref:Uncharacterized protein n=1 Tax=Puccinia graminis f. sp. tritici (strain CRL 75-36-700-3 / race SCCL) TaxID=418459 RepID=E3KMD2_PUCGT|nr:uncharacterized protein PGTG_11813 [Puccinia graminis f. sp. tritici CRL 75-36-700-3]EFP85457.2 hypothetical protein PGTG_11813 [Puccinia graminis f. sp. tritici CRL 75-36-700-3]
MQSFLTIASVLIFFHSYLFIGAKPTGTLLPGSPSKTGPSKIFPYRKYEDFQISDGVAGQSLENAQKVFVTPFEGKLSEITQTDLNNLVAMSIEAIQNEQRFNQAQGKTGGSKKNGNQALAAGKTANKVLKLVGEIQVLELHKKLNLQQLADPEARLKEHQVKLAKNTKLDRANRGKKMVSFLSVGASGEKDNKEKKSHKGNK